MTKARLLVKLIGLKLLDGDISRTMKCILSIRMLTMILYTQLGNWRNSLAS